VATGSGGVAVFAAQIARQAGARVALVTGTPEKGAALAALVDALIPRAAGWGRAARSWAGGEGVDHVLDLGGESTMPESLAALRPGGRVSVIGVLGGPAAALDLRPILMNAVTVQGVFVGDRPGLCGLVAAAERGAWRPVVHEVTAFDDLPGALRRLSAGQHVGKIALLAP
jgi:NADPH:quinone reductase-like Zn-dependent oxidoreductase